MNYLAPIAAVVIAVAFLGLQIVGGLEYTAGGTLYTQASMIFAMVGVFFLPGMIESAWGRKSYGASGVLTIALLSLLAYSLPATTGRTGEVKEAHVVDQAKALEDKARIEADYAETKRLVTEANAWQASACKGGVGKDCKSATFVLNQRTASLEKLAKQLEEAKPVKAGDVGSDIWASVTGLSSEQIRKTSILAYAIGLEASIFGLMWFAGRQLRTSKTVVIPAQQAITERPKGEPLDEEIEELAKLLAKYKRELTNQELAEKLSITKGEASKRATKAVEAGVIAKRREGREVFLSLATH